MSKRTTSNSVLDQHKTLSGYCPKIIERALTPFEFAEFKRKYAEARKVVRFYEPTKFDYEVRDFAFKFGTKATIQKYGSQKINSSWKITRIIKNCAQYEWNQLNSARV